MSINSEVIKIIDDAIDISNQQANSGVNTYLMIDGTIMTNYVPFRKYFLNNNWTQEMSDYVKNKYFK